MQLYRWFKRKRKFKWQKLEIYVGITAGLVIPSNENQVERPWNMTCKLGLCRGAIGV